MKQEIVPTSPKSEYRIAADNARKNGGAPSRLFVAILFSIIFGLVSGMAGFLIAVNVPSDWPVIGKLNVIDYLQSERDRTLLSVKGSEKSLIQEAPQVLSEIAAVYSQSPDLSKGSTFVGNAVAATTDGWLVVATSILPAADNVDAQKEFRVILTNGESYEIKKRLNDGFSGVSYIQINASNLDVATFSGSTTVSVGQLLSVIEKQLGSYVVYERRAAGELTRSNALRSTQKLDQYTVIDPQDSATSRASSPVFNNNGELLGMTLQPGVVVPASIIYGGLQSVILNGELKRVSADISYINVSRLTDAQRLQFTLAEQGMYVYDVKSMTATDAAANTELALLKKGDFITAVNGVNVTEQTDLTALIHSKQVGSTFQFTVQRDGKTVAVEWKSE